MSKVYSPIQVQAGTFIGGPLAAIYFLRGNFTALGMENEAKKTLQIGLALSLLLVLVLPYIPEATPGMLIPLLYFAPVAMIVKKHMLTKEDIEISEDYGFHSSWKVFGMSMIWMVVFILLSALILFALQAAGIINIL